MIDTFSVSWDLGCRNRKTILSNGQEWHSVTAGDGSYVSEANLEVGSTKCHVLIGRYCSIAHRVIFTIGLNHDYSYATTYPFDDIEIHDSINVNHCDKANKNQIIIGNDVWIGCDALILGGVHIGNGAVIGARAVVAKNVPPYSIVVGNPARVIKYRFTPDVIQQLNNIKWWYWSAEEIKAKYPIMKNMDRFLASCKAFPVEEIIDETVRSLQILKQDSYYIYYLVADVESSYPIWRNALAEYLSTFSDANKVLLVIEVFGNKNDSILAEMAQMVEKSGANAPIVVPIINSKVLNKSLLHLVDTYITTREEPSSVVVDFMSGMEVDIIYGLDYGGHIFDEKVNELGIIKKHTVEAHDTSWHNNELLVKKEYVERKIASQRKMVRFYIEKKQLDSAFSEIFELAQILYEYNQFYTDDELEDDLSQLNGILSAKNTGTVDEKMVLFYDGFGLNNRGLAEIYLDAIDAAGYRILYITTVLAEGHIPKLKAVLDRNGAEEVYILQDNTVEAYQKISDVISQYCPSKAFLYTTPYDIPGILTFMNQAGKMIRYQINLTDHAFWLGRNAFDYCLEFRDYGASVSANYRKIPAEKLIRMNYYPAFDASQSFDGFPFHREIGDFIIFSGGFLYKTMDENRTYYKIVEHCLHHKNVKFWYAGYGDITELQKLCNKYPGRVFHTTERSDLFAVMKNVDMYLSTFPLPGGLMYQYSAMAGLAPLTLINGVESLGILLGDTEMEAFTYNLEDHLKCIDRYITDASYRQKLNKGIEKAVCTRENFIDRIKKVLVNPTPSEFDLTPVAVDDFRLGYLQRFLEKIDMVKIEGI